MLRQPIDRCCVIAQTFGHLLAVRFVFRPRQSGEARKQAFGGLSNWATIQTPGAVVRTLRKPPNYIKAVMRRDNDQNDASRRNLLADHLRADHCEQERELREVASRMGCEVILAQ